MSDDLFDYDLPPERIAQQPLAERDLSRLLVVPRDGAALRHHIFRDLPTLLRPGDLLILNDSRVIPARLIGKREATGGAWEGLFLQVQPNGWWEMLAQTRGYPQLGETFVVEPGPLRLTLQGRTADRHWLMQPQATEDAFTLLQRHGQVPLPPYIRKGRADADDVARYQTVYARHPGSVAAPTAGLHFTEALLERLAAMGVQRATVTLHVGLGTFEPMRSDDPSQHVMHREWCAVSPEVVTAVERCKAQGGRAIAVGTTVVRTLESAARLGTLTPFVGETDLFIRPPFTFHVIDGLITNFHLPKTTLLLLVAAFIGRDRLQQAYQTAIAEGYRFYSYGDAMLAL